MSSKVSVTISDFGTSFERNKIKLFTLKQEGGLEAKITNFGGILTELHVPNKEGNYLDVVLGFKDIETYLTENTYAGAIVGRVAGRIKNASFSINGITYKVAKNDGNHHVHGGNTGFDKRIWEYEIISINKNKALKLTLLSLDGEEGFPGNLVVEVIYSLTIEGGLKIEYRATTDAITPVCLTNHSYFNLSRDPDIKNHSFKIYADKAVEVDDDFIPTGNIKKLEVGINDFRTPIKFRDILYKVHGENYILNNTSLKLYKAAQINCKERIMEVFTTASNLQFYSGIGLNTKFLGKNGSLYKKFAGFCMECQGFSNAMNHNGFKSILLNPKDTFTQVTEYRFK